MSTLWQRFLLIIIYSSYAALAEASKLGSWSETSINQLLQQAAPLNDAGTKIDYISQHFLNTRYQAHTLIGDAQTPEQMVIRLDALDCMTFIENIEALRRAQGFADYQAQLQQVRYHQGVVAFKQRKHFFADWLTANSQWLTDVTDAVGGPATLRISKQLNQGEHTLWIEGLPVITKEIHYIPTTKLDDSLLERIQTGDYIGNYSPEAGLDVNHVGIAIRKEKRLYLRHANAEEDVRKVMDSDFMEFFKPESGIIVFRPHSPSLAHQQIGTKPVN